MMEAFNFLSNAGGGLESVSLNGPSIANYHLYGSRVYDSPFSQQPLINPALVFDEDNNQVTPLSIELSFAASSKELEFEEGKIFGTIENLSVNRLQGLKNESDNNIFAYVPPDRTAKYIEGMNIYR